MSDPAPARWAAELAAWCEHLSQVVAGTAPASLNGRHATTSEAEFWLRHAKAVLATVKARDAANDVEFFRALWLVRAMTNIEWDDRLAFVEPQLAAQSKVQASRKMVLRRATANDGADRVRYRALADAYLAKHPRASYESTKAHIVRNTGARPGRVVRLFSPASFKSVRS